MGSSAGALSGGVPTADAGGADGAAFGGTISSAGISTSGRANGDLTYVPTGLFDPAQVYISGTLEQGACYRDALSTWANPNQAETGFSCSGPGGRATPNGGSIRPSDGRFVFMHELQGLKTLRVFVPDGNGVGDYPARPHDNDPVVHTLCEPADYFMDPAGGDLVYACSLGAHCLRSQCSYYRESGASYPVPEGYSLLHLGLDGTALLLQRDVGWVVRDAQGALSPETTALSRLPEHMSGVRAHDGGFWLLRTAEAGDRPERLNIGLDGALSVDGQYPAPEPPSAFAWPITNGDWSACAIERAGTLLCFATNTRISLDDRILRMELGANKAEVVYSEATFPLVKLHISALVTGP